jgi:hypothetical protein
MSSKQKSKPKVIKLKKKVRIKKRKTCDILYKDYDEGKIPKNISNLDYQNLLNCISDKDRKELAEDRGEFSYLYPNPDDPNFNVKIANKKEFFDTRYEEHGPEDYEHIEEYTQKICDNTEFELDPHQMFVRNFMSFQTPYNGLLLYHGLGTGKTCSAISICEEMRTYLQQMGITKRLIIVASPAVQENFKLQLFDERKLRKVNGLWNIKACIGNKFIKEINPMNMKGLSRSKVIRQIKRLIRQSYLFKGYGEFANYIEKIMNKSIPSGSSPEMRERMRKKNLRKEFSNRMLVIDEVHNIRLSKEGKVKTSSDNLGKLVEATNNLKLLLLSATPMFDSYSEIIWILNLLLLNDKRCPITQKEIFTTKGAFQTKKGEEIGKDLLIRKSTGYVSYVRGENPFTFPYRIWPREALNPESFFSLMNDGIWKYPNYQINGAEIIQPIELIDLVINNIGEYQNMGYEKLVEYLKNTNTRFNKFSSSISFTVLEAPLQALNMIYPHKELKDVESTATDEDIIPYTYGSKGLARVMLFNPKTKRNFIYKDETKKNFGEIFSPKEIGKYSGKIAYICDKIRNSEGIVFVYSQYIDGGAVPIALALESMGITRYGTVPSLFKKPPTTALNVLTMKPKKTGETFKPAKYIMITGQKSLTPDVKRELKAATDVGNANGEKVKVIIVSRAGSEGLDFQNIRQMHILDPWYNMNRSEQIIGRAVRSKSHCMLPYTKRNVEIYLYGTQLVNQEEEAIDLYIYRVAERKALLIANVTRVLKETAVDCLLNRKGLDFSEKAITAIVPNHNKVQQQLSTGPTIEYTLGDKDGSLICDFRDCEYKCTPSLDDGDLDRNTYNETFIIMNLDKILQRIRNLFKEKYVYQKTELLKEVTAMKSYPLDQIYTALSYLINDDNEFITDTLGRMGNLVNIGNYYMFQPVELTNKHISRYDRVTPIPYKRDHLTFILSDLSEQGASDIGEIIIKLKNSYQLLLVPQEITSSNRSNWAMGCAWAINNLVKYNATKFGESTMNFYTILQTLAMHHIIDILTYEEKTLLLKNTASIEKSLLPFVESYFDKFKVNTKKYEGIVITDFNKKSKYSILTLKDGEWIVDTISIEDGLGKAILDKFTINIDNMHDKIGFMAQLKRYNLIFKVKSIYLSSAGRPTKGSSCERGADKKVLIDNINHLLSPDLSDIKYVMGAKTGKGARTITKIYDKEKDNIKQHPYSKKFIETKTGSKLNKSKTIRLNAFQLCIEQELLFRYFDSIKKDNKRWFFSSMGTIINNIDTVGKERIK